MDYKHSIKPHTNYLHNLFHLIFSQHKDSPDITTHSTTLSPVQELTLISSPTIQYTLHNYIIVIMHNYVINLCIVIGVLITPWAYQSSACPVLIIIIIIIPKESLNENCHEGKDSVHADFMKKTKN